MLAMAVSAPGFVIAAPVGPALERPAVAVRAPQRVVLMGAAQAGTRLVAVGERGVVALSDDQGKSWRQASVPTSVGLTAVRFVDAKNGWAVGHGGVVLASRDGGENWVRQFDGLQAAQLVLKAAKASGDAKAQADAERMVADGVDKPFLDLHFSDAKNGLVVGAYNLAFVTEDGGATWQLISSRLDNPRVRHLYAVRSRGDELVIVGEEGVVLYSADRGQTFKPLSLPYKGSFFTVALPPGGDIVVAGLRGNALRSPDRGANWVTLSVPGPVPAGFVSAGVDGEGRVWLGNQAGALFKVEGDALQLVQSRLPPLNDILFLAKDRALGLSMAGVVAVSLTPAGAAK